MKSINNSDAASRHVDELISAAAHKSFLGQEFLIWLWHFSESEAEGRFEIVSEVFGKQLAQVWLDDKLKLSSKIGASHDHTIQGGNPSQCEEAALALRQGKSVRELRVGLDLGDAGLFHFTLVSDDLSPRNIILPVAKEDSDVGPLEQRVRSTVELTTALDHLMTHFMNERSGNVWEASKLESIREWIKSRVHRLAKQSEAAAAVH
jgi:hypothetical protein